MSDLVLVHFLPPAVNPTTASVRDVLCCPSLPATTTDDAGIVTCPECLRYLSNTVARLLHSGPPRKSIQDYDFDDDD